PGQTGGSGDAASARCRSAFLLQEETLRRCREDEEKRSDITNHFQETLEEIQAQIELHSGRNDKLRQENANLNDKLENLMSQYERESTYIHAVMSSCDCR
uniref:Uncharacterized protein n=1 Tax=Poecilia reticulata TaxID=8081 RepID=A0A3P9PGE5_POERE